MTIECENLPITPIVWNGRLFPFWLKTTKQSQPQAADAGGLATGPVSNYQVGDMQNYATAPGRRAQVHPPDGPSALR